MSESPSKEEILALWLEGNLSDEEVMASLGKESGKRKKKILEVSSEFSTPFSKSKEEAWEMFSSKFLKLPKKQ